MSLLVLILLLAVIGALPAWSYSDQWGYDPSGGLGLLLVAVVLFAWTRATTP
jgi:Protein of unknown function (DUF3309)